MKYFTKEWCFSDLDDHEIEKRLKSYREYIGNVYEKLPFVLKILSKDINLHDGRIKKASFIKDQNIFVIEGVFGDLQSGYYLLEIKYVNISKLSEDVLVSVFKDQEIEVLSDEIEVFPENYFSHRMLFSTKKEINMAFKDIQIVIRNAAPKDYTKSYCQFKVI